MRYIIETGSGANARILACQDDGTYRPIAQLFGDEGLQQGVDLVNRANNETGIPKASH